MNQCQWRLSLFLLFTLPTCFAQADKAQTYAYRIIAERAHSEQLFTQGLYLHDETFFESSGGYGHSRLIRYAVDSEPGDWILHHWLPDRFFAEGLTLLDEKLYLLTWREGILQIFSADDFKLRKTSRYEGEGWGLTDDGTHLIRSDGSHRLFFHEPDSFGVVKTLEVRDDGKPVRRLNELEYIDGRIWANIWKENRLVEIDAETGIVTGYLDLTELSQNTAPSHPESVLNGIAWDEEREALWVTGKNWPRLFLIKPDAKKTPGKSN